MTIIEPKTEVLNCLTDSICRLSKEVRLLTNDGHAHLAEDIELTIKRLCVTLKEQTQTTIITPRMEEV